MAWPDAILRTAFSVFLVMSLFYVALPLARPQRPWAGVGLAWLTLVIAVAVVGLLNTDKWKLDCAFNVWRTSVTSGIGSRTGPCASINDLPLWLVAIPPTLGILILLGWVWRHTRPAATALRVTALLVVSVLAVVLVGQIEPNLGLLLAVLMILASYSWPWIRNMVRGMNPRPGAT